MALDDIPQELHALYEIHEWRHASAVLVKDFPVEWDDVCRVLRDFRLRKSHIAAPGGSKSLIAAAIDLPFLRLGWRERLFETSIKVDDRIEDSPTHKVDCFKNKVGIEIEWNNKDPFYDRDLNNFRLLFELRALSVGIIITRCDELQAIFNRLGKRGSYGNSTTHMSKLLPRLRGGAGGGCPVLVFGIRDALLEEDIPDELLPAFLEEFRAAQRSRWREISPTVAKYIPIELLRATPPTEDDSENN